MTNRENLTKNNLHQDFRSANDPETSIDSLILLSQSSNDLLRGGVALNKSTPDYIIELLLSDTSEYVSSCLRKRGLEPMPLFLKPKKIIGNNLILKNVSIEDASFILELRTNEKKSKHISATQNDLQKQIEWLKKYNTDNTQIYFLITNKDGDKVGTVRLYDKQDYSFCWGSWILKDGLPSSYAIESALLVYHFALSLGFKKSHFDVRKGNESVWKFHERFGATRLKETDLDYIYNISIDEIEKSLLKYKKYLPNGFNLEI